MLKISNINHNSPNNKRKNNSAPVSFNANIHEFNDLAKKALVSMDKNLEKIFDGKSKEFKKITFEGKSVDIRLWGWPNSDTVSILAYLKKDHHFFGHTDFNLIHKKANNNAKQFFSSIKEAVDGIGISSNYVLEQFNQATKSIKKTNPDGSIIEIDCSEEKLMTMGKDFAYSLKDKGKEISNIKIGESPLKILIANYAEDNKLVINVTYKDKTSTNLFANSIFSMLKANGEKSNVDDLIIGIKRTVKKMQAKQKDN